MDYRRIATFTGWLWIITFVTSISARLFFYAPVLDNEGNYVTGAGNDAQTLIAIGALLELLLIIANVGTAVARRAGPTPRSGRASLPSTSGRSGSGRASSSASGTA
jgi:hypothetical protein